MRTTPALACLSRPGGEASWYAQSAAAYAEMTSAKQRCTAAPAWSKAVMKWAASEAAGSSTEGSGRAPSGPASSWECRAALRRRRSRAGALLRLHFDHAAALPRPAKRR
eukprot:scaffold77260_cov48-Phaeocystis_antarctica.AAC.3